MDRAREMRGCYLHAFTPVDKNISLHIGPHPLLLSLITVE